MTTMSVDRARRKLSEISRRILEKGDNNVIMITDGGEPTMVMVPYGAWEALLETVDIQSDDRLMDILRRSAEDVIAGRVVDQADADDLIGW